MGKGDKKTRRGKLFNGSFGKRRKAKKAVKSNFSGKVKSNEPKVETVKKQTKPKTSVKKEEPKAEESNK